MEWLIIGIIIGFAILLDQIVKTREDIGELRTRLGLSSDDEDK